jgi:diadenosine tetraphosphate (Ap4A) HIT family hydrolase
VPTLVFSPNAFHQRIRRALDEDLPSATRAPLWKTAPFRREALAVVPLGRPLLSEPRRAGEGGSKDCGICRRPTELDVWANGRWRLYLPDGDFAVPLLLVLAPKAHLDIGQVAPDLAQEMGTLIVKIVQAVEVLPGIARAHVCRWGDGAFHLHLFIYARPQGFEQLRGTWLEIWDLVLPTADRQEAAELAGEVSRLLRAAYAPSTELATGGLA